MKNKIEFVIRINNEEYIAEENEYSDTCKGCDLDCLNIENCRNFCGALELNYFGAVKFVKK